MIFGTDGIRGLVNCEINTDLCYKVGKSFAYLIKKNKLPNVVCIGIDTRVSSETYAHSVASGLMDNGVDVIYFGVVSTPFVSFAVSRMNVGGGVMITASHNDNKYNGIKLFNYSGEKLENSEEIIVDRLVCKNLKSGVNKGKFLFNTQMIAEYIEFLYKSCYVDLSNKTIVIDCANGSNYNLAISIYKKMGANIIPIACTNNGKNINKNCGANYVNKLVKEIKNHNADYGIAFDGDGDRLRIVLGNGRVLSGDEILLIMALELKKEHHLNNLMVVGTIMSNLGFESVLKNNHINLIRTDVGDKNIIAMLKSNHYSIGGEPSGHICIFDANPTCDALYNSLFFMKTIESGDINIEQLIDNNILYPNKMVSVKVNSKCRINFDNNISLKNKINMVINMYKNVKVIVRPSGTEPVIRIYVESVDNSKFYEIIDKITQILKNAE